MQQDNGTVEGMVEIGPLHPGPVRVDEVPEVPVELYATHRIVVVSEDGETKVSEASISPQGEYRVNLAPGKYYLDFQPNDIGMRKSAPVLVEVVAGETVRQDLYIDTGMR